MSIEVLYLPKNIYIPKTNFWLLPWGVVGVPGELVADSPTPPFPVAKRKNGGKTSHGVPTRILFLCEIRNFDRSLHKNDFCTGSDNE